MKGNAVVKGTAGIINYEVQLQWYSVLKGAASYITPEFEALHDLILNGAQCMPHTCPQHLRHHGSEACVCVCVVSDGIDTFGGRVL